MRHIVRARIARQLAVAVVLCMCGGFAVFGQGYKPMERPRFMDRIDEKEGARKIEAFRNQRLEGDYCFRFELEHLPRRGATETYHGVMWGSWNAEGPVTRVVLQKAPEGNGANAEKEKLELIVRNGPNPRIWERSGGEDMFEEISGKQLFDPLLPGIVYTPFHLQMPFIYWQEYEYEGPDRIRSRVGQQFLMFPPADSEAEQSGIKAVRIAVDDAYNALLQVEVIDAGGAERSRVTVESFKKAQGQYIVKSIELTDNESHDRTRFRVRAASLGLELPQAMFDADSPERPPELKASDFDSI
ncbi:MAG: hypothetical protein ACLFS4_05690 [Opitutales bacterium]